jgi:hypothetical protein
MEMQDIKQKILNFLEILEKEPAPVGQIGPADPGETWFLWTTFP